MKWRQSVAFLIVATASTLVGTGNLCAQGVLGNSFQNWNFLGGGARARGMGGAYIGVSDDAYAGSWNPAGLVYNEGVLMALNYSFSHYKLGLDNAPLGQAFHPDSRDAGFSNLGAGSFVAPLKIMEQEFVLSAFYNRIQDVYSAGTFTADIDPKLGAPFTASYEMKGNVAIVGGSFGTAITHRLTLGGTLGLITGSGAESHIIDLDSTRDTASFSELTKWTDRSNLHYHGLTATFGAMYKAGRWSAGAILSPGFELTQNLDFRAVRSSIHDQIPYFSPYLLGPLKGTDRKIEIPYTVGVGGSYHLTENVLVAADYQFRAFHDGTPLAKDSTSSYRIQNEPREPKSPIESQPVDWYSLHQVRLGAEYRHATSWGTVPLRLGVRNEPMLFGKDGRVNAVFEQRIANGVEADFPFFIPMNASAYGGSQVNGWTLSLGSGIQWSQVRLDLAFEWTGYRYNETGSLSLLERCADCRSDDPSVQITPLWGKRKLYKWGDYSRDYNFDHLRILMNFTGNF
ncbi:MAG: hypothetical protein HY304_07440 [candidate division Zixibacteria bacterium]|nr:hypothetical protein [candidate division Zixibacteria bacterium]